MRPDGFIPIRVQEAIHFKDLIGEEVMSMRKLKATLTRKEVISEIKDESNLISEEFAELLKRSRVVVGELHPGDKLIAVSGIKSIHVPLIAGNTYTYKGPSSVFPDTNITVEETPGGWLAARFVRA